MPLTVDFHEPQILAQLNAENHFTLQHGFWFQLTEAARRKAQVHRGPLNPQDLNRYTYVRNSPLNYTDPTGHCFTNGIDTAACSLIAFGGPPGWLIGGAILLTTAVVLYAGIVWMSEAQQADEGDQQQSPGDAPQTDQTPEIHIGEKVSKPFGSRGWTEQSVKDLIKSPDKTVTTRDTRHLPDGTHLDDPATAYIDKDGNYVVRNDRTGDIVQVSDRNDPDWKAPWDK